MKVNNGCFYDEQKPLLCVASFTGFTVQNGFVYACSQSSIMLVICNDHYVVHDHYFGVFFGLFVSLMPKIFTPFIVAIPDSRFLQQVDLCQN